MPTNDPKICWAIWDTVDSVPAGPVRDLVKDLNHALDSMVVPIVDRDVMAALDWAADNTAYTHMVIYQSGTVLQSMYLAQASWYQHCQADWLVSGHIMLRPTDQYPWLHDQAFAININLWKSLGRVYLGDPARGQLQVPAFSRSPENIHDDYTPVWLRSADGSVTIDSRKFGWNIIATSLANGIEIPNIPIDIRKTKFFTYPHDNGEELASQVNRLRRGEAQPTDSLPNESQQKLIAQIQHFIEDDSNSAVFVFNTGNGLVNTQMFPQEIPDALWNSASGFKSFAEWWFRGANPDCQINTYDFNPSALRLWKTMHRDWDGHDIWNFMQSYDPASDAYDVTYCWGNMTATEDPRAASYRQERELAEWFGGPHQMRDAWRRFQQLEHSYHEVNLVSDPGSLIAQMRPGARHFIWLNNIFYFRRSILIYGIQRMNHSFRQLVEGMNRLCPDSVMHGQSAQIYFENRPAVILQDLDMSDAAQYQCNMEDDRRNYKLTYPTMR